MKKIFLITSSFPYGGGEQFLETEMNYYKGIDLTIIPKVVDGEYREISKEIKVDKFLAEQSFKKNKYIYLLKSLRKKVFFQELLLENFFNVKKLKYFFASIYLYQMYYEIFDKFFEKNQDVHDSIIYTYWNDEATYALQSLKSKYQYKLISRIHGGDLYKERQVFNYMPLKKQFTENINTLYTITQSANKYLEDNYGFNKKTLKLSKLGVKDRGIIVRKSQKSCFNIVSCSYLIEVKQVDKIIKSLKLLVTKVKDINFSWVHIGDGILYHDLVALAKKELDTCNNIKYIFVGNYTNEKVYEFYSNNEVDVFLNVSLSEGVPVSIMEAMSCHVPIIAPSVGGISDMVKTNYNGTLLSDESRIEEIVEALSNSVYFKNKSIRENSYQLFLEQYNADKNYKIFLEDIGR